MKKKDMIKLNRKINQEKTLAREPKTIMQEYEENPRLDVWECPSAGAEKTEAEVESLKALLSCAIKDRDSTLDQADKLAAVIEIAIQQLEGTGLFQNTHKILNNALVKYRRENK